MRKNKLYSFLGILIILMILLGSIQNNFVIPSALEEDEIVQEVEEVEAVEEKEEEPHVHAFGEWEVVKEPTTSEEGEEKRVCECGESETRNIPKIEIEENLNEDVVDIQEETAQEDNIHIHEFGEWKTVTEPTEDMEGLEKRYCECGEVEEKTIPKLEKKKPVEKVAGSTVTKSTIYLNVVFDNFSGSATFKATNAEGDVIASKTVTGSTNVSMKVPRGEYATISCELDGENLNRVESTFSTFSGKFSNTTYSLSAVFTYTACQHTKTANITLKRASYTDTGTKIKLCLDCGEVVETITLDKLVCNHSNIKDIIVNDSTENTTGSKEIRCADCGTLIKTEVIPKKEHVHSYETQITPATCQQEGSKTKICTICGDIESIQTIAKTSHTFDEGVVTKEPTCVVSGLKTLTCEVCGFEKTETISATGHNYEVVSSTPATCQKEGNVTYICTNCNDTYSSNIQKTGHNWNGEYVIDKEATCTSQGLKSLYCKDCGELLKMSTIAKKKHQYSWVTKTYATNQEDGLEEYICDNCGKVYKSRVIPKFEDECSHEKPWDMKLIKEATCNENAHYKVTCKICGEVISDDYQEEEKNYNADNHVGFTSVITKKATTKEEGIETYTCTGCGYSYEEAIEKVYCLHNETEVKSVDGKLYFVCKRCEEIVGDATQDDCPHQKYPFEYITISEADSNTWGIIDAYCTNCRKLMYTEKVHPYSEYHVTDQNGEDVTLYGWFDNETAMEIFNLTNDYRQANGLNRLIYNTNCQDASNLRALEALVYWGHTRPNGTYYNTANNSWSKASAENLAAGSSDTAANIVNVWKNSSGHNENMLGNYNKLSVSVFHQYIFNNSLTPTEKSIEVQNFAYY